MTPDRLRPEDRRLLEQACDEALAGVNAALRPRFVVGFGGFAARCASRAIGGSDAPLIGTVLHPSPASPAANRGWQSAMEAQLRAIGVPLPGGER